jgi:hypothetical protein
MGVIVDFSGVGGSTVKLLPGQTVRFGRAPGPGQIGSGSDRSVSYEHGEVRCDEHEWQVSSLGSLYSFNIYDTESSSRLLVPLGHRVLSVPFYRCVLCIEIADRRWPITVQSVGSRKWNPTNGSHFVPTNGTRIDPIHDNMRFRTKGGRPLRWYQVLVALCEPRFLAPHKNSLAIVESRIKLAERLGMQSTDHLDSEYLPKIRDLFGLQEFSGSFSLLAESVSTIAVAQGLVTYSDLKIIDE